MPSWKKVILSGSNAALNSLTVINGITGSLLGTSSFAVSASWAPSTGGSGTVTSIGGTGTVSGITLTGTVATSGSLILGGAISGLTNSNLSGTAGITNANLANSAIQIGSTNMSLGMGYSNLLGLSLIQVTGSVIATQGITGSLFGTASFALNAATASTAIFTPNAFTLGGSPFVGYVPYANGNLTLTSSPIYYTGGNLGVNTTVPSAKLDVNGTVRISSSLDITGSLKVDGVLRSVYLADPGAGAVTGEILSFTGSPYGLTFRGYSSGVHSIQNQREANDAEVFALSLQPNGGKVGIGKLTPNAALDASGSAIITGSLNVSAGITGSLLGNASTATTASFATAAKTIAITLDNATNTTYYPIFTTGISGNLSALVDNATLTYNPGTNTLTTTTFAGTATNATNIAITNDTATNATFYPVFSSVTTGNAAATVDSTGLTFNPSTNTLTVANFAGNASTATTATNANNVVIANQDTTPVTYNITFTGTTSGTASLNVDATTLTYNPSTSTFTTPIVNSSTAVRGGNGSAAAPALSFSGDTDTGIYNYAANALGIATGGALRMYISSSGVSIESGIAYNSAVSTANVNGEIAYWGGGSVTAGNLYYYDSSGNWSAADADSAGTSNGMLGIALATGTASAVGMLLRGHARFTGVTSFTGTTTVGALLYVSQSAGAFSQTPPTGTGTIVRIIGYVQSTANDQIYFCPDNTFVELV